MADENSVSEQQLRPRDACEASAKTAIQAATEAGLDELADLLPRLQRFPRVDSLFSKLAKVFRSEDVTSAVAAFSSAVIPNSACGHSIAASARCGFSTEDDSKAVSTRLVYKGTRYIRRQGAELELHSLPAVHIVVDASRVGHKWQLEEFQVDVPPQAEDSHPETHRSQGRADGGLEVENPQES